tara:strand:+ start:429 stop:872 length:444 start_codon:yes stop_codon:yes gene_type:complete
VKSKRLKRLVRLRELVEKSHVTELEERRRSLDEAEHLLAVTYERMTALDEDETASSADELMRVARFQTHLEQQAAQQKDEISDREAAVMEGLEIVRRAWQDRRLLQHMQDNAEARETHDAQKRLWKEQDALAINSYAQTSVADEESP